ncbi:MAG: DNA-directed RNA polymerase subunit omega [Clostridia bacterium]|nr:DNA-directed RNA polymerase subunit omega [Clostridia bacterium]MBP5173364.1 DNA-directed RNA polymerase subunit omega [Clostridia bacterium]
MIYPTINSLTKGKFNRYQLALAAAKCARLITDEYVEQRRRADKASTGNKDVDRANAEAIVNPEYRDKKAVKLAIDKIYSGEYVIVERKDDGSFTTGEKQ